LDKLLGWKGIGGEIGRRRMRLPLFAKRRLEEAEFLKWEKIENEIYWKLCDLKDSLPMASFLIIKRIISRQAGNCALPAFHYLTFSQSISKLFLPTP
jgi:hypothetical protein